MGKILTFFLVFTILIGLIVPANKILASEPSWETAMNRSLDWIYDNITPGPVIGSVGGEWAVLALARANRVNADDPWVLSWLSSLERTLAEVDRIAINNDIQNPASVGTFPSDLRRWTDFQRVTLALSSLGIDASNYNGRDLTEVFRVFIPATQRHPLNQTINVDTFALIALDTMPYRGDRDSFIQALLEAQRADGSWSLTPDLPSSAFDLDITAMAIIALASYYSNDIHVTEAVNTALSWLRLQDFSDPESVGQTIVALTSLGMAFASEAHTYVNKLMAWFDPASGGFRRPTPNDPVNLMATEQAAYALTAYWRFVNGMSSLYNMSDAFSSGQSGTTNIAPAAISNRHPDVRIVEIISPNIIFRDIQDHFNREAIETLAKRGIVSGRNENIFDPDTTMTRAEFATIITRSLGLPPRPAAVFDDVTPSAWFAGAVGTAFYYEIVSGITESAFNPSGIITRQEAALMVARGARLTGLDTNLGDGEVLNILAMFGDYRVAADWAWNALAFSYREGILDDSHFYINPATPITRGEIAEMLYQMLNRAGLI
ncbi:MAG: S-layer homology domain-containing protein [Defluviitaleaceae bacterium]|nr:S-layer homology domain-containing protein [Defluviitaleaceae bacterium]